jgi:hypothetical protein
MMSDQFLAFLSSRKKQTPWSGRKFTELIKRAKKEIHDINLWNDLSCDKRKAN